MNRHSWFTILLLLVLFSVFAYFALLYRSSQMNLFLGLAVLWTILISLLASFPYGLSYLFCLPSPVLGGWLLITIFLEKQGFLSVYFSLLAFGLSALLVFLIHFLTRTRTMVWRLSMSSLSRSSIAAVSLIFLVIGFIVANPSAINLSEAEQIFYFAVALISYVSSSMLYINYSYRLFALNNRLNFLSVQNVLSKMWVDIQKKYPTKSKDLDLLEYYFQESFQSFLEGDFEKSLDWGYKVIHENTVVNPLEYVDDKRVDKPSFSYIRNRLEHSRRGGGTEVREIRQIMKNLFAVCLDLLEREFVFIKKVSEGSVAGLRKEMLDRLLADIYKMSRKRVLTTDGVTIGELHGGDVNEDERKVTTIHVALEDKALQELGLKKPFTGRLLICLPVSVVGNVNGTVTLVKSLQELKL